MKRWIDNLANYKNRTGILVTASVALIGIVLMAMSGPEDAAPVSDANIAVAQRGNLTISVAESGTIRPRDQVVLKNQMDDPSTILFIVPEGSIVKKGDLLVELDVTRVETELIERRIRLQNAEAELIHAQENLNVVRNQAQADIDQAELD
jgi:HlyD family secretion protein